MLACTLVVAYGPLLTEKVHGFERTKQRNASGGDSGIFGMFFFFFFRGAGSSAATASASAPAKAEAALADDAKE